MIKSLRSLCLLEVSSLGHSYKDLPSELVKELDKMKLFNGNFSLEDNLKIEREAPTIKYDGVSWTFQSRSQFQPELYKFTVAEGETVEPMVNSSIKVYLGEGSRVMLHSFPTMESFNTLAESTVSAENAFKCHGLVESYDDWDESDFWYESNDDYSGDDDWYLHDNDSHIDSEDLNIDLNEDSMLESFKEFWVMIQNS